ncbi:MAG: electron transfer flavoprotein subunit beta/FixA family protein [Deltaproteobacteria bacterium]|nr:electron transfer flavoprotein subunit beta/FixA family protein [Deltaproteobacteria bacterium]
MKIVVCVKQVPQTDKVKLDPETHTLKREGVESIINPFDLFALEAALAVREAAGGEVAVLSMGPPQAAAVIKEAIGYGADQGLLMADRAFAGSDTWATTRVLAAGVEKLGGADLIICGKQAIDGDTAQVGPGLAQRLGLPQVAFVKKIKEVTEDHLVVERQTDEGWDVVKLPLPGLITVVREVGEPRPPSLKGKMRAKTYQVPLVGAEEAAIPADEAGLAGSFTQVKKVFAPQATGDREIIPGTAEEAGAALMDRLAAQGVIVTGN